MGKSITGDSGRKNYEIEGMWSLPEGAVPALIQRVKQTTGVTFDVSHPCSIYLCPPHHVGRPLPRSFNPLQIVEEGFSLRDRPGSISSDGEIFPSVFTWKKFAPKATDRFQQAARAANVRHQLLIRREVEIPYGDRVHTTNGTIVVPRSVFHQFPKALKEIVAQGDGDMGVVGMTLVDRCRFYTPFSLNQLDGENFLNSLKSPKNKAGIRHHLEDSRFGVWETSLEMIHELIPGPGFNVAEVEHLTSRQNIQRLGLRGVIAELTQRQLAVVVGPPREGVEHELISETTISDKHLARASYANLAFIARQLDLDAEDLPASSSKAMGMMLARCAHDDHFKLYLKKAQLLAPTAA